jgi:hypothetical protein
MRFIVSIFLIFLIFLPAPKIFKIKLNNKLIFPVAQGSLDVTLSSQFCFKLIVDI